MPKSKRSIKRRRKVGKILKKPKLKLKEDLFYTKTDGDCRLCLYDKNHKFIRFVDNER